MWYSTLLQFFALVNLALAEPGSNFNISSQFANSNDCGKKCQQILNTLNAYDLSIVGQVFDFDFYATAKNFSKSKPGDILKLQPVAPSTLDVKAGTTVYRLQYTSLDLDGKTPVPVTGFIAFPYAPLGDSPGHRFRSVAFAHGTIGLYPGCAPSNGPSLFNYDSWELLLDRGYAVIATDYAGLGNNYTQHKYCSFPAHANDVYYSMIAARRAFGSVLSNKWVSVGHSQGGGAVWKLAESELVRNDCSYLGTVALAPATRIVDMALEEFSTSKSSTSEGATGILSYAPFLGLGLQRFDPSYNLTLLGPKLRKRIAIANRGQTCASAMEGLTLDLTFDDIISLSSVTTDMPFLLNWQNETAPSSGTSPAPILVLQGLNDTTVLPNTTHEALERSCANGNDVNLSWYPGVEHSPLLPASAPEWLAWIDARFAGRSTSARCSAVTRKPFRGGAYMKLPPEFDLSQILGPGQLSS